MPKYSRLLKPFFTFFMYFIVKYNGTRRCLQFWVSLGTKPPHTVNIHLYLIRPAEQKRQFGSLKNYRKKDKFSARHKQISKFDSSEFNFMKNIKSKISFSLSNKLKKMVIIRTHMYCLVFDHYTQL